MRRQGFVTGFAAAVACVMVIGAAGQLDPIFDTLEVDDQATFHGDADAAGTLTMSGLVVGRDNVPASPSTDDVILFTGDDFPPVWDGGVALPSGATGPAGVAADDPGEFFVADNTTRRIYARTSGSWGSGIALPTGTTSAHGITLNAGGDIVIVSTTTDRVYTRTSGSWDSGIAIPSAVNDPRGVAFDSSGNLVIVADTTHRVYTRTSGSWDSGIAIPSVVFSPQGIALDAGGNIAIVGDGKVFTFVSGSWGSGIALPESNTTANGMAFDSAGDLVIVDNRTDRVYTRENHTSATARGLWRWVGTRWEVLQ